MLLLARHGLTAASGLSILAGASSCSEDPANDLTPGYAADVAAGDDLYCHVAIYDQAEQQSVVVPVGFVIVARQIVGVLQHWILHRLADGTETDSLSVVWSAGFSGTGTRLGMAQIHRVRGHTRENAVGGSTAGTGSVVDAASLTVAGSDRTGLLFGAIRVTGSTPPSVGQVTGESGGDWQQEGDAQHPFTNQSGALQLWSARLPNPTTVAGGMATSTIGGTWSTVAVAAGTETAIDQPPATFDQEYDVDAAPYNAAGDGVTDDRAAIQAMFDDIEAYSANNPNHTIGVHFGAGKTYRVATKLFLQSVHNVHVLGDQTNPPTISRHGSFDVSGTGSSQMLEIENPDSVTVWDMIFDGRRDIIPHDGAFGHLVVARGGDALIMWRCTFMRSQAVGLKIGPIATGEPVEAQDIPTNYECHDCLFTGNAKQGVTVDYVWGLTFIGNTCEETGSRHGDGGLDPSDGFDIEPLGVGANVTYGVQDLTIRSNTFRNNDGGGFTISGFEAACRNIELDTNLFENNGLDPATTVAEKGALYIRNGDPMEHNIHVHNNSFINHTATPSEHKTKGVINIHNLGNPSVLIENNDFSGNTGAAYLIGTRAVEGTGLITIRGNTFDASDGLTTGNYDGTVRPFDFRNNQQSVFAVGWSNMVIENNIIIGDGQAGAIVGINFDVPGAATPDGASAISNDIRECLKGIDQGGHAITTTPANTFTDCGTNIET